MDAQAILQAALVLGGVGLTFGILVAVAHTRLKVWEDPRIEGATERLPGSNCGACGFAGCRAFAEGLIGDEASPAGCTQLDEGGIAEVTNIRIDVFEEGAVFMTVFAPKCYTQVVEQGEDKFLSVESEGDVLIDMEQMTIAGRGFLFTSENNRFEILSEAKVLVKEAAQNMKGLEL